MYKIYVGWSRTFILNETWNSYAIRNILILDKINFQGDYVDFVPKLKIKNLDNIISDSLNNNKRMSGDLTGVHVVELKYITKPLDELKRENELSKNVKEMR